MSDSSSPVLNRANIIKILEDVQDQYSRAAMRIKHGALRLGASALTREDARRIKKFEKRVKLLEQLLTDIESDS